MFVDMVENAMAGQRRGFDFKKYSWAVVFLSSLFTIPKVKITTKYVKIITISKTIRVPKEVIRQVVAGCIYEINYG